MSCRLLTCGNAFISFSKPDKSTSWGVPCSITFKVPFRFLYTLLSTHIHTPMDRSGSRTGTSTNCITILTISTAIHPSTSSIMCRNTARSLNDFPLFKRSTAKPLTTIPKIARYIIPLAFTLWGSSMRSTDSFMIIAEPTTRTIEIKMAPSNEKRLYP